MDKYSVQKETCPGNSKRGIILSGVTTFFLFFGILFAKSEANYSQETKLTLNAKSASIKTVCKQIEKKCDYIFVFADNSKETIINKKVDIEAHSENIETILDNILHNTGLEYKILDRQIVVYRTPERVSEKKPGRAVSTGIRQQPFSRTFSGRVTDIHGEPLIGVSIKIKDSDRGTSSDTEGNFSIMPRPGENEAVFVFSYIGFKTLETRLNAGISREITMQEDISEISEVVVTGIYQRRQHHFTGSASTYTAKEIREVGNQNILQSLKTLDPAFALIDNVDFGSDPNRLPEINVRGTTSVSTLSQEYGADPNRPLFILDGFESNLATIMDLNIDRVASITVLKDASATAIYGSKAANGVIVVETVRPEKGKLKVNFSTSVNTSFADLTDFNLMDASEKLEFEKLSGYYGDLSGATYNSKRANYFVRLAEIERGVNSYWLNKPLRTGITTKNNLYVDGGDETSTYGLGISYGNTQGVMKGSNRQNINGNFKFMYRFKNISFNNQLNIDVGRATREAVDFSEYSKSSPFYRMYDENGRPIMILDDYKDSDHTSPTHNTTINIPNPLYDASLNNRNNTNSSGFRNNVEVDWRALTDLRLKGRFSISQTNEKGEIFNSPKRTRYLNTVASDQGVFTESNTESVSYNGDMSATFGKLLADKHLVNLVGGFYFSSNTNKRSGYTARGFIDDKFTNPAFSRGFTTGDRPDYSKAKQNAASFYFNSNYVFNDTYLIDLNLRSDGSSIFGIEKKFTTTWSAGLAWNIHKESFMSHVKWINLLKLRGSVGNPGNQNFDAYLSMNIFNYVTTYPGPLGVSAVVSTWGNKNLEWQKTLDKNIGLDLYMFSSRLRLSLDHYRKDTNPMLAMIDLAPSTGGTLSPINIGGLENIGYLATLNAVLFKKGTTNWTANANIRHNSATYKNIGESLSRLNQSNRTSRSLLRYYDNGSPNDLWAVKSAGIDPTTGREIFIKKNGDQTFVHNYEDEVVVGNRNPTVEGVIGTSFTHKGFSVAVNMRYRVGGQLFQATLYDKVENISESDLKYNQDRRALHDRWKAPGDISRFKAINLSDYTPMSSRFVADDNTLVCESVSAGYETRSEKLKTIGLNSLSVRAYMNDIFRISSVKEERGIRYPFSRTVSASLRLTF